MKQLKHAFLLTLLMSMVGIVASAHDIEVKNSDGVTIYYVWNNDQTELAVSYRGSNYDSYSNEYSGKVVIPQSVTYNSTSYSVTSIGEYAFYNCKNLTSVSIPNSITSIGSHAFSSCICLSSLDIPNSVTSIGENAISDCAGLRSVTIPESVTTIGIAAFRGCYCLPSVDIPNSVTSIDASVFDGCI